MARKATKAADNVYYLARVEAASCNDRLGSREGAAEIIGIDRTRLARIELGSLDPYPEEVLLMADVYNAPELGNHFCSCQCPLGKRTVPQIEVAQLDRLTIQVFASLKKLSFVRDSLTDIVADGVISDHEKQTLSQIMNALDAISKSAQALKLWAEKNLK